MQAIAPDQEKANLPEQISETNQADHIIEQCLTHLKDNPATIKEISENTKCIEQKTQSAKDPLPAETVTKAAPKLNCHEFIIKLAIAKLAKEEHFDIYNIDSIHAGQRIKKGFSYAQAEEASSKESREAYEELELLHCCDYREMPDNILESIPTCISIASGIPVELLTSLTEKLNAIIAKRKFANESIPENKDSEDSQDNSLPPLPPLNLTDTIIDLSIKEINTGNYFNISPIGKIQEVQLISTPRAEKAYEEIRPLHCIDYEQMPDDMLTALPLYIATAANIDIEKLALLIEKLNTIIEQRKIVPETQSSDTKKRTILDLALATCLGGAIGIFASFSIIYYILN